LLLLKGDSLLFVGVGCSLVLTHGVFNGTDSSFLNVRGSRDDSAWVGIIHR
jgi:hypothetical protein